LEKAASRYYLLAHTFPHSQETNARADQLSDCEQRTLKAAWMVYAYSVMQFTAHFMCGGRAKLYIMPLHELCAIQLHHRAAVLTFILTRPHNEKLSAMRCIEFAANDGVFESSLPHIYPRRSNARGREVSEPS
jgi:hypothetical protein